MARVGIAAGLVAIMGLSVGAAYASSLGVDSGQLSTTTSQACSTATLTVTETPQTIWGALFGYSGVRLSVPAGCAGTDLHLTVYSTSTGAAQATATAADLTGGTLSVATSATFGGLFNPAYSIAVTFDGWSVPATI